MRVSVVASHLIFELFDVGLPAATVGFDFRRRGVSVLRWAVSHDGRHSWWEEAGGPRWLPAPRGNILNTVTQSPCSR